MYIQIFLIFCVTLFVNSDESNDTTSTTATWWRIVGRPLKRFRPCKGVENIEAVIEVGRPPGEENQYLLLFHMKFVDYSRVVFKFDSEATVILTNKSVARLTSIGETFFVDFFKPAGSLQLDVKGPPIGTVPYPTTIIRNFQEICSEPNIGFLDDEIIGYKDTAQGGKPVKQTGCGRRKVDHTGLIYNGQPTQPGDWPWHVAIYRLEYTSAKYICGGTLIAKSFVLTAGHCVTINGVPVIPQILSVVLGKYNLIGGDLAIQERLVHQVIVHEEYFHRRLHNDIALLKLKTEAIYDDYVQPACIWNIDAIKRLPAGIVYGTVVGWGLNHTNNLSSELHQATLPKIGVQTCLKSNPNFFGAMLNERKFCAGYTNGTSACNGDSGGAFLVFIPDIPEDSSANATGAWYINGIVSLAVKKPDTPVCDTSQYTIYTDVHPFIGWIDARIRSL